MYVGFHVKYPLFFFDFNKSVISSTAVFFLNSQIPNFMKIRLVEDELIHSDRQTDTDGEANSPFAQFCEHA